jgi:HK97 gp10 family phage protein
VIKVRIEGGDRLAKTLREMPNRASRKAQRDALSGGAALIQATVQATAPREPGAPDLADNIGIQNDVRRGDGQVTVGIGVPRSFFYDWFNEFGTVRQQARPFWRPAFDSDGPRAVKSIVSDLWAAIIRSGFGSSRSSGGGTGL